MKTDLGDGIGLPQTSIGEESGAAIKQTDSGLPKKRRRKRRKRSKKAGTSSMSSAPAEVSEARSTGDDRAGKIEGREQRNGKDPNGSEHNPNSVNRVSGEKTAQKNTPKQHHYRHSKNALRRKPGKHSRLGERPAYAALDLGTNNCRLLVAVPDGESFRVVDAFSRIVRLGEGIGHSNRLSNDAMDRAIGALKVCAGKLKDRGIKRVRLIATEACRIAENGEQFLERVLDETGLRLEIVDRETEARLAVAGCASLVDPRADGVILFDIGGGSSELVWLDLTDREARGRGPIEDRIRTWMSLPVGVVNVSERHGGKHVTPENFEGMVEEVMGLLEDFPEGTALAEMVARRKVHMLGTSGTVTTLAGVHLGLDYYDRRRVDGIWMSDRDVGAMTEKLLSMSFEERRQNACIGRERADLVLAGCAILEAVRRKWPCSRLRVADRGLREGILHQLMNADGALRKPKRRRGNGRRRRSNGSSQHSNGANNMPSGANPAKQS
ncbi:MAG: Ppx/GppA phosphatase family protein [Pseudomonadota bacterium]